MSQISFDSTDEEYLEQLKTKNLNLIKTRNKKMQKVSNHI